MRAYRNLLILLLVVTVGAAGVLATTWAPSEVTCPVCGKTFEAQSIASYGSYIYNWPSKYQMVFWPHTTKNALYFCPKCHHCALMEDFTKVPKEKVKAVEQALKPLKQKVAEGPYNRVDIAYRLRLAEAVYLQLDKDEDFWCFFYRMAGYLLDKAGQAKPAAAARAKALSLAEKLEKSKTTSLSLKELRYFQGAMLAYLGKKDAALTRLALVQRTPIQVSDKLPAQKAERMTSFLDKLAVELSAKLEKGEKLP